MKCPACERTVDDGAWICPFCEYILDPSFLDGIQGNEDESQERTAIIAWPAPEEDHNDYPDAVILGDVGVSEDEFEVVHGAQAQSNGRTSTFLFYTAGTSTRILHPRAIPRPRSTGGELPHTPYEDFILSCVDGQRTVRQIQKTSGLAPQEVVVTLLTLLDKGAIFIETLERNEATEARLREEEKARKAKRERAKARRKNRHRPRSSAEVPVVDPQPLLPNPDALTPIDTPKSKEIIAPSVLRSRGEINEASPGWPSPPGPEEPPTQLRPNEEVSAELIASFLADDPDPPTGPSDSSEDWTPPNQRGESSYSDVWAPVDGVLNADNLIEDAESASSPRPLSASAYRLATPEPVDSEDVTREVEIPDDLRDHNILEVPPDPNHDLPHGRAASAMVSLVDRPPSDAPVLDPAFLMPAEPSQSGPRSIPNEFYDDEGADFVDMGTRDDALQNFNLSAAPSVEPLKPPPAVSEESLQARSVPTGARRNPIQERDRRRDPPPEPSPPPPDPSESPRAPSPSPVDNIRMMKAQKLFDQALQDKAEGNLVSAKMNMKLALTFDPTNQYFHEALEDLSKNPEAQVSKSAGGGRSMARQYYEAATEAENHGDVDRAIELLEKAIKEAKQPAFYNRLGFFLAMKKREFVRAQQLVEKAIELAPGNLTYEKNLQKILSRAALDVDKVQNEAKDGAGGKLGGLLGFLGRRK